MLTTLFLQLAVLLSFLPYCHTLPLPVRQKRDAGFWAVRTKLAKDYSGAAGDPPGKYFHESIVSISLQSYSSRYVNLLLTLHHSFTHTMMVALLTTPCLMTSADKTWSLFFSLMSPP
jgi:hypothetical protein